MKDKLDQHLDRKLRESYADQQAKAPEGLWERLDQQLSADPTDTLLDQKLKEGYEQLPTTKAPMALWASIADELPSNVPADADALLDQKLKASYAHQQPAAPTKVWQGINRQLNIDKTWVRIEQALDHRALWAKRGLWGLQGMVLTLLLLLMVRTCEQTPDPASPIAGATDQPLTSQPVAASKPTLESLNTNSRQIEAATSVESSAAASDIDAPTSPTSYHNSSTSTPTSTTSNRSTQGNVPPIHPTVAVIGQGGVEPTIASAAMELSPKAVPPSEEQAAALTNNLAAAQPTTPTPSEEAALAVLSPPFLSTDTEEAAAPIEPLTLTAPRTHKLLHQRLTVGVFLALNSTALLNNETREGFDYNSLTINYFGVAANYGLWARYQLAPRHAVLAEYSINADNRQAYGVYEKGKFRIKEWVMKYNRVGLAYQWTMLKSKPSAAIRSRFVTQVGVYAGMLRSARLLYDGKTVYDRIGDYHTYDGGIKLGLIHEVRLDNIVIGYGVRSDIGFTNVFKGNTKQRASENKTNLLHLGGYCSIGYQF